jgi:hypothetical protein
MRLRRAGGVAAVSLVLAGCLGGTPTPAPSTSPDLGIPVPSAVVFTPATTAWVAGFVVSFERATADLDPKGGPVTVILTIQNPGDTDASLDVPIQLTSGETAFALAHGTELPEIAAGGFAEVRLEFEVVGQATIDDGVLRIGRPGDHRVAIPLAPSAAQLVTLEPEATSLDGSGRAGNLRLTTRSRVLRWDLPDWHDELPLATEALTVNYDITNFGTFAGGMAFTADNVRLRLPDGTLVAPRSDGHSQSIVLIGSGKTARDLFSRFEIPSGTIGRLAIVIKDGSKARAIPFEIGP